jgi:hypothetical protein
MYNTMSDVLLQVYLHPFSVPEVEVQCGRAKGELKPHGCTQNGGCDVEGPKVTGNAMTKGMIEGVKKVRRAAVLDGN